MPRSRRCLQMRHRYWAPGQGVGNARSQWSLWCKVGKHVSDFPIGAMGTFEGLCGTYILKLTEASVAVAQARIKASA